MKKQLFNWFVKKEKTFTVDEVSQLVEEIKEFNAGAIDAYLTKHADKAFEAWLNEHKEVKALALSLASECTKCDCSCPHCSKCDCCKLG